MPTSFTISVSIDEPPDGITNDASSDKVAIMTINLQMINIQFT